MKRYIAFFICLMSTIHLNAQTGIGTTAPVNKFQVETPAAAPLTSGTGFNGNIRLGATSATQILDFGLGTTFGWLQSRDKNNYGTNYNLLLNPNGSAVGVGTYSPSSTLTVGNAAGTIPGEITLNPTTNANEGGQITIKKSLTGSIVDWTIDQYGSTSSNARLRIFSGNSETNGIAVLENGNVGIGTIAPSSKMSVSGDVSVTGNLTGGNVASSKLSGFVSNTSTEAANRSLATNDNGMILKCTSALTITLPVAGTLPEGFNCMVLQYGTGQVTFSGTFSNRNSFTKTAGQYAIATVLYIGGIYIISGEMSN